MKRISIFLLLCVMISGYGFAETVSIQYGSENAIVQCLTSRASLNRYHVYIKDRSGGERWVIERCDDQIEVFLPSGSERIHASLNKRLELLDAFDKSAEFVIRALSVEEADKSESILDHQVILNHFSFTNLPEESIITNDEVNSIVTTPNGDCFNTDDIEIFDVLAFFDRRSERIYAIEFIPFVVDSEYCAMEMYVGYAYEEKLPEFNGVENSIAAEIGERKDQLIDEIGCPVFDFGQTCVYQDEYDNSVIVAFDSDIVSCYACFTAESELFLISGCSPISEYKTRLCLGKSAQEMQHFIGEFHGTLDLNEDSFPFYITQDARIAYFVFDRGVVKQIYSIDILTGNIQNISGMQ